jgi:hypothetical protein
VDATPFTSWITRLTGEHAAVGRGAFDPMRYISVRAQLNTVSALVADLDIEPDSPNLKNIRAQLHSLLAATQ